MMRKVIIDTDPGIDDILAIATAFSIENLNIIGVSTVRGNVPLSSTSENARLALDVLGVDTPLYIGSESGIVSNKIRSSNVHGVDGLGNLYESYRAKTPAIRRETGNLHTLATVIRNSKEPITIIAIGPLTNIAKLLIIDPSIKDQINEIHIMGGGLRKGNTTDLAEFNFYCDPVAAQIVIKSGIKIFLSALDATSEVYFTQMEFDTMKNTTNQSKFIKSTLEYYMGLDPYLHDVLAVLTLSNPELFRFKKLNLDVLVSPGLGDGMLYECRELNTSNVYFTDVISRTELVNEVFEKLRYYEKE